MPASPFDSVTFGQLMGDPDVQALMTDSADVRGMLIVEGALAKAQGAVGLIPEVSAAAIHRASMEVQVDPAGLADETGRSGVVVPALVAAFREAMQAPEHAQYVHWGATSQDIMDTGQVLRLKRILEILEGRLRNCLTRLADLAEAHAETPMAGRTYGQIATPTSFGAVIVPWGAGVMAALRGFDDVRARLLRVSLSGAAGTLGAMGPEGPKVRATMAEALGLGDPGGSWHSDRNAMAHFAGWCAEVLGALGKMGADIALMAQTGIEEVTLGSAGGSSTMPQKQNPVAPSVLVALARHGIAQAGALQGAVLHQQQRDGAAWFTEWLALPQLVMALGAATRTAESMIAGLEPRADRMRANIDPDGLGLIHAEALSFALTRWVPRPEAQAKVKAACKRAAKEGMPLLEVLKRDFGALQAQDFVPEFQMGQAPHEARAFAKAVRDL